MDLIPGSGRALGEGNRNPLKYSCLGKPMEKEAWQAEVLKVKRVEHDLATKQQQQNQSKSQKQKVKWQLPGAGRAGIGELLFTMCSVSVIPDEKVLEITLCCVTLCIELIILYCTVQNLFRVDLILCIFITIKSYSKRRIFSMFKTRTLSNTITHTNLKMD